MLMHSKLVKLISSNEILVPVIHYSHQYPTFGLTSFFAHEWIDFVVLKH